MNHKHQQHPEAKFFKGLADESRLSILKALIDEPQKVGSIVELTGLSQPNVSMHLACLLDCGLVKRTKDGREVTYEVSDPAISSIIDSSCRVMDLHKDSLLKCERY